MKTITIKVPEGIFKMAQSIAFQQDGSVEDLAAEGLAHIINSVMKKKLGDNLEPAVTSLN